VCPAQAETRTFSYLPFRKTNTNSVCGVTIYFFLKTLRRNKAARCNFLQSVVQFKQFKTKSQLYKT
jgi:hypothetical protein